MIQNLVNNTDINILCTFKGSRFVFRPLTSTTFIF